MQCAVARAEQFGIGACLAVRVSHWGRAFSYAYRGTQSGMIGICMTNAIPNMVSWNSSRPLLANNPLAIGVPRKERFPVVLDMAMSQAAMGKIGTYAREGKPAPDHWGLDEHGNPTNDPKRILDGKRILPFGEHKGTGLGLMIEILTGALSGTMLSQEIVEQDASGLDSNSSKLFIAVNISDFSSLEQLSGKIEQLAEWLHATEPGADIIFPGDHSWKMRERFLQEGIPLHQEIVDALQSEGLHLP
jgi:LDH2 family malate/lactate/ureidoglycolate dehydrogenase